MRARTDLPADMERAHRRWKAQQRRQRAKDARRRKKQKPLTVAQCPATTDIGSAPGLWSAYRNTPGAW